MRAKIALVLLLGAVPAAAQQSGRAFTPADWYRLTTLSSPAISPDGQRIAFVVTTVREAENARHSEIWIALTAGGEPVRYTSPGTESSNPRWSHDGKYLFFTSNRPGGRGNTWVLRMDLPGGEAFQISDYPSGSMPADHRFAIYTAPPDGELEDGGAPGGARGARGGGQGGGGGGQRGNTTDPYASMPAQARPPFGSITKPLDARRFDGRHYTDLPMVANGRGFLANPREAPRYRPAQLWQQMLGDTAKRRLTNTAYSHRGAVVSPDGQWIAFSADPRLRSDSVVQAESDSLARLPYNAARDEADRNDADIFIVSSNGGEPRRLTTGMGSEGSIAWSPDGRRLLFNNRAKRTADNRLYVVDVAGGQPRNLLGNWKYEPGGFEWLPNGDILMDADIGGRSALFRVTVADGRMTEILGGRRRINGTSYDQNHTKIAFVATSVARPTELYVADIDGRNERRLTSFNDRLNAEIAFPDAERFTYNSVGGLEIEAWLMKPWGYEPGRKYPVVLYIHGGPHSAYGEGWFDEFHNLAGAGMFVLFTNPRGSSGYGADFTYSTRGRWGMEDYEDLMKAVDIVAKRPDIDSTRMGVTGGSYGGFMTAWVTTRTNRFRAAQADRMISDWAYWYGASDAYGLTEFEFYGKPWDNFKLYDELSPIRYVQKVQTPTLIVQSEEDFRTRIGGAEEWFVALEKRGIPVEFVRYPRSTHDLSRTGEPWLLVDRLARLRQWFAYWLKGETTAAAGQPASSSR
jgi:dipeptidyl aminopeptidase/acylaminoacyl peptidase